MNDVEQIRRQLSHWMQLDDGYRDDEWVEGILAEEFSFFVGDRSFVGKKTIRELNIARNQGPPRGTHILSEPVIDVAEDGATAHAATDYVYFSALPGGDYEVTTVGQYTDDLVKDSAGVWRVSSRTNKHLLPPA